MTRNALCSDCERDYPPAACHRESAALAARVDELQAEVVQWKDNARRALAEGEGCLEQRDVANARVARLEALLRRCVGDSRLNGEIEALRAQVSTAESDRDELIAEAYGVRDGVTEHTTIEAILEMRRVRENWSDVRNHVTSISYAGARNDERQSVFVEIRDMMARLDALARLDASGSGREPR